MLCGQYPVVPILCAMPGASSTVLYGLPCISTKWPDQSQSSRQCIRALGRQGLTRNPVVRRRILLRRAMHLVQRQQIQRPLVRIVALQIPHFAADKRGAWHIQHISLPAYQSTSLQATQLPSDIPFSSRDSSPPTIPSADCLFPNAAEAPQNETEISAEAASAQVGHGARMLVTGRV